MAARPRVTRALIIRIYLDTASEWRWRAISSNGRIVADSGEGYKTAAGAEHGFKKFWYVTQSPIFERIKPEAPTSPTP